MGIFGALTTAVTGMRAQAFALENISGNIANSQTTGFKRTDTSFEDLIQDNIPSQQKAGNVVANARSTNTVQGDVQSAAVSTYMAINGAGYYLMGIPVDSTTGNLTGSVPTMLQFQNGFLPAQQTSEIDYRANLASYPKTVDADPTVPGSELLNPSNFTSNPINGSPAVAKLTGFGAGISPDAAAVLTASADLTALSAHAGSLVIMTGPL